MCCFFQGWTDTSRRGARKREQIYFPLLIRFINKSYPFFLVLENLRNTNESLYVGNDEIEAIMNSVQTGTLVMSGMRRIISFNQKMIQMFKQDGTDILCEKEDFAEIYHSNKKFRGPTPATTNQSQFSPDPPNKHLLLKNDAYQKNRDGRTREKDEQIPVPSDVLCL